MRPFAQRCTKRLQHVIFFFFFLHSSSQQDKLMAVREQHFTQWLTDRSLALPDKQELSGGEWASSSQLFVFFCALCLTFWFIRHTHTHTRTHTHAHTHKKKHVLVLCSSAFVHQFSEGPVQINYSSCIVVFLILTVKVTLLSPTVLKAIHELHDDSCRRRELWHHSSQWGSKSRDVDVW